MLKQDGRPLVTGAVAGAAAASAPRAPGAATGTMSLLCVRGTAEEGAHGGGAVGQPWAPSCPLGDVGAPRSGTGTPTPPAPRGGAR